MKSFNFNNSLNKLKKKTLSKSNNNTIYNIKVPEKDTNIRNQEKKMKSLDDNNTVIHNEIDNLMDNNLKQKAFMIQKTRAKNYFDNNIYSSRKYYTGNNSYSKKIEKDKSTTYYNKKINNYNNLIHEKRNSLLNINSYIHKKANNNYRNCSKIALFKKNDSVTRTYKNNSITNKNIIQISEREKDNKSSQSHIEKINTAYKDNVYIKQCIKRKDEYNSYIKDLEYEFEMKHLKKKKNKLSKINQELNERLIKIKELNTKEEKNFNQIQDIKNNLINLYNNSIMNNGLGFETIESNRNNSVNEFSIMKKLLLNIMEIKYEYENSILLNNFYDGIKQLLNISSLNNNEINSNIHKKIDELLREKKYWEYNINSYRTSEKDIYLYKIYFDKLFQELKIENFEEFDKFLKNCVQINIIENKRIDTIKKALINNNNAEDKKMPKKKNKFKYISKSVKDFEDNQSQTFYRNESNINNEYSDNLKKLLNINYTNNKNKKNNLVYNFKYNSMNQTNKMDDFEKLFEEKKNKYVLNICDDEMGILNNKEKKFTNFLYKRSKKIPLNYNNKLYSMENNKSNEKSKYFSMPISYTKKSNILNRYIEQSNMIKNDDDIDFLNRNEEQKDNFDNNNLNYRRYENNLYFSKL